jgi:hypothetical protein
LTLSASVDPTAVYPGKSVPVSITISNAAGHGNVRAGSIAQDGPVTGLPVGCNASWFSFASVPVNQTLLEGGSASVTGALAFTESGTDQSACSAANPVLHVALAS